MHRATKKSKNFNCTQKKRKFKLIKLLLIKYPSFLACSRYSRFSHDRKMGKMEKSLNWTAQSQGNSSTAVQLLETVLETFSNGWEVEWTRSAQGNESCSRKTLEVSKLPWEKSTKILFMIKKRIPSTPSYAGPELLWVESFLSQFSAGSLEFCLFKLFPFILHYLLK